MKNKIQIKSIFGKIVFELDSEGNTKRKTIIEAIKQNANLSYANLSSADLSYANLSSADLSYADLSYADLSSADLSSADLRSANLSYANLRNANLRSVKNGELIIAMTRILPAGEIVGWKKCDNDIIVKLLIPKEAKRSNAFGRKCRAEYAKVLEIEGGEVAYSNHDHKFEYKVGEIVKPKENFCDDWTNECASGIHFFITKLEAINYNI